jgi:hypothetical protein
MEVGGAQLEASRERGREQKTDRARGEQFIAHGHPHALYFSGGFSGCCWSHTGRPDPLYLEYRVLYSLLLETAL